MGNEVMSNRIKNSLQYASSAALPAWGGLSVVIVATLATAKPTWQSYVAWAGVAIGIPLIVFIVTYIACKGGE